MEYKTVALESIEDSYSWTRNYRNSS